jgi:sarcosine oxidase subunit gamma
MSESMSELRRTTALADSAPAKVRASEANLSLPPARTLVRLRGHMDSVAAILRALPELLPAQPLCAMPGEPGALWLAPDSWLLTSQHDTAIELQQMIAERLTGLLHASTDLSDALTLLRLEGPDAAQVLSASCGLSFHDDAFPAGHCSRTRFAHLPLLIHRPDDSKCFELYIDRSYAQALWNWLLR